MRVLAFGKALSRAREKVIADLGTEGMTRERGCAVAVRLLDLGYFRIGNDVYADENASFGLTTLERRHTRRRGAVLVFDFVGKSGIEHRIEIDDEPTIEALDVMRKRRGTSDRLLAYREGRRWRDIDSGTVNDYIRETTGMDATAKDFRTWHATVLAAAALAQTDEPGETQASQKRAVSRRHEGGVGVPRQHAHARPVVVRRPPGDRRLRGGPHHRRRHPPPVQRPRRAAGGPGAGGAQAAAGDLAREARITRGSSRPAPSQKSM